MSLNSTRSSLSMKEFCIGRKAAQYTSIGRSSRACSSVMPMEPYSGWVNTAEGTRSRSTFVGLSLKTVSTKAAPSRIATGVRLTRLVTSPTA